MACKGSKNVKRVSFFFFPSVLFDVEDGKGHLRGKGKMSIRSNLRCSFYHLIPEQMLLLVAVETEHESGLRVDGACLII